MLSATSQYALRALTYIAAQGECAAVLGRQIARDTGIPANYLSKILIGLNSAGIVTASRGTGGGYRLATAPERITLDQVVAVFDRDIVNPCCLLGYSKPCSDENACTAHFAWKDTREKLVSFLHLTTLADIATDKPKAPKRVKTERKHSPGRGSKSRLKATD